MTNEPTQLPLEKKVIRSSPLLWILSAGLCFFLCELGTQGMWDVAELVPHVDALAIRNVHVEPVQQEIQNLDAAPDLHQEALNRANEDFRMYANAESTAEANFRTWLETRSTLGKHGNEDAEIRVRRDELAKMRAERDLAETELQKLRAAPDPRVKQREQLEEKLSRAQTDAENEIDRLEQVRNWKALGLRLLIVAPVWALAGWLWKRKRASSYLTLLWGYWAFAMWMLVWGVEPYLPHYGGYARYALAIAILAWASVTLVRWFNARAERRRQRIVEKAIAKHRCPSCDRGYLVGRETELNVGLTRKATARHFDVKALRPRGCPFCGQRLFGACATCGNEQPVHLDHCASCDAPWKEAA